MPDTTKKILIVEDEKPLAKALVLKLTNSGYQAKAVYDGGEALEILKQEHFDLIILDLMMPKKDGFAVLKELQPLRLNTKIVVTSNLSQEEDFKKAKELGATELFIKSEIALAAIVQNVNKFLNTA